MKVLKDITAEDNLEWTNPLSFAEFRNRYFLQVYSFLAIQYGVSALVCFGVRTQSVEALLRANHFYLYGSIAFLIITYLLLFVKPLNNFEANVRSILMQILFTVSLVIFFTILTCIFDTSVLIYTTLMVSVVCVLVSIGYYFEKYEFHNSQGVRSMMHLMFLIGGTVMLSFPTLKVIKDTLSGIAISALFMFYFAWGTIQLTLCKFVRFRLNNSVYGVTLIYTSFVIPYYYKM